MKKLVKVTGFGSEAKKSILTSGGDQYFLPESFRDKVKAGVYAVVASQEVTPYKRDEQGNVIVNAAGDKVLDLTAPKGTFYKVIAAGNLAHCVSVKNADEIIAKAEARVATQLIEFASTKLEVTNEELAAAI